MGGWDGRGGFAPKPMLLDHSSHVGKVVPLDFKKMPSLSHLNIHRPLPPFAFALTKQQQQDFRSYLAAMSGQQLDWAQKSSARRAMFDITRRRRKKSKETQAVDFGDLLAQRQLGNCSKGMNPEQQD